MTQKIAERTNVLTESKNKSFIHAVINAVTKGYADKTVLEDVLDLVRKKEVSKGVLLSSPEALREYAESFKNSLEFLATEIEQLEVVDEPIVQKKEQDEPNVVEEEMKAEEAAGEDKKASFDKFANLSVKEDWDAYHYDEEKNCMSGLLKLNFNTDMKKHLVANKIVLDKQDTEDVVNKIFSYYATEFKNFKANLTRDIFKTNLCFTSVDKGLAEVEYEIKGAF
jgi:hypothetical protein